MSLPQKPHLDLSARHHARDFAAISRVTARSRATILNKKLTGEGSVAAATGAFGAR
jgi:hypothetical protein